MATRGEPKKKGGLRHPSIRSSVLLRAGNLARASSAGRAAASASASGVLDDIPRNPPRAVHDSPIDDVLISLITSISCVPVLELMEVHTGHLVRSARVPGRRSGQPRRLARRRHQLVACIVWQDQDAQAAIGFVPYRRHREIHGVRMQARILVQCFADQRVDVAEIPGANHLYAATISGTSESRSGQRIGGRRCGDRCPTQACHHSCNQTDLSLDLHLLSPLQANVRQPPRLPSTSLPPPESIKSHGMKL